MENLFQNLSKYIEDFNLNKKLVDARKAVECICKILLKQAGVDETEYSNKLAKSLIDLLTIGRLKIESDQKNALKLIKNRLESINNIASVDCHDNDDRINEQDFQRVTDDLSYIISSILDNKSLDLDIEIPPYLMQQYKTIRHIPKEDWKCTKILSLIYPNREIKRRVLSSGSRFDFFIVHEQFEQHGFLFLGRNISFNGSFDKVKKGLTDENISVGSLTILFPNEISRITGKPVLNRKESIENKAKRILGNGLKIKHIKCEFIDKFILENCLPKSSATNQDTNQELQDLLEPYYVDQLLYSDDNVDEEQSSLKSSEFINRLIQKVVGDDIGKKPISLIYGSGGVGKTTFCHESVNLINQSQNKKAILISSSIFYTDDKKYGSIQSLQDLLKTKENLFQSTSIDNLEINIQAGNLIIVIDGIDEIISKFKENFMLNDFIDSVKLLNDTYLNCTLLMTSRSQLDFQELIDDTDNVELYQLKGFDLDTSKEYFRKKFKSGFSSEEDLDNLIRESMKKLEQITNKKISRVTPLILKLISDLVWEKMDDDDSYDSIDENSSYFLSNYDLDNVIYQVIQRELLKQSISSNVTCDDYFEILNEVVCHDGRMPIQTFKESVEVYAYSNVEAICKSPFLKLDTNGNNIYIGYDSLISWFQCRSIYNFLSKPQSISIINEQIIKDKLKPLTSYNPSLVNEIIQIILKVNKDNIKDIVKENSKKVIEKLHNPSLKNMEMKYINAHKRINFNLLFLLSEVYKVKDKDDLTTLVKDLYLRNGNEIIGLCILDSFRALNFNGLIVRDSYFESYSSLFRSTIPKNTTVFFNSNFSIFDTKDFARGVVSKENFDKDCAFDESFKDIISISNEHISSKKEAIENDLYKILKCAYSSGGFGWKYEGVYKQQCKTLQSELSLKDWLDLLVRNNFLSKIKSHSPNKNSDVGYEVCMENKKIVSDFITQRLLSPNLRNLLKKIE